MQIIETIELISINGTLIFQLISFLIFLFLIQRIMLRPLRQQDGERKAHLDAISQDIVTAQKAWEDLAHRMVRQEENMRQAAFTARDELEAAGNRTAENLLARAREEIDEMRRIGHKQSEAKIASVRKEFSAEAETIARQMMVSLLGRRIEIR